MNTNCWSKLVVVLSAGLLFFLNFYTLLHAVPNFSTLLGLAFLFLAFLFGWRFLSKKSGRFLRRASLAFTLLMLAGQIGLILLLRANVRYDAYWILDEAVEMLETGQISPTISDGYFTQVPNNYGLTLLTYWYLKLLAALGLPSGCFMRAVQFLNIALIDGALLMTRSCIRRFKGEAAACFFSLLCLIAPYPYLWASYYYTSTASLFFACLALVLWLAIRDCTADGNREKSLSLEGETGSADMPLPRGQRRRKLLLCALLGVSCITGFKVRATSLIAYIALALFFSVCHRTGKKSSSRADRLHSLRQAAPAILVFVLSAALTFGAWKQIVRHYVPFDTTDTAFPVTHFIMMGSRWDGSYNQDDRNYTISLPTAEAKREGTIRVIKERLAANGFSGNVRLLLDKLLNCWEDGTDSYIPENSLCTDFNELHTWLIGSKSGFTTAWCQIFRAFQLLAVCLSCIWLLRKTSRKRREPIPAEAGGVLLLALNLLGGMLFHLLWEAGPLYSLAFMPFSYALACDGIEGFSAFCLPRRGEAPKEAGGIRRFAPYALTGLSALLLLGSAAALFTQRTALTETENLVSDFVVNQHMNTVGEANPELESGQVWTQTFEAEDPFNTLDLFYGNDDPEHNTSSYQITLSDADGQIFYDDVLYGNDTGYDLAYTIQFETVVPAGRTCYSISIRALSQDAENFIHFESQDCSRVDLYPYGTLTIDGADSGRDLAFRVRNLHLSTCVSKKEYGLFSILLLGSELFFVVEAANLVNQKRRTVS